VVNSARRGLQMVGVHLPRGVAQRLRERASEEDRSIRSVVRRMIVRALDSELPARGNVDQEPSHGIGQVPERGAA
jgi:hypothetical protein